MPCKANSKSAWLELQNNLENFEKKLKMKSVKATADAVSESGQLGIKVGSVHFLAKL